MIADRISQDLSGKKSQNDGGIKEYTHDPESFIGEKPSDSTMTQETFGVKDFAIPDGTFWGWMCVFSYFMTSFICWGGNTAFSIYLSNYLQHNTFHASAVDYAAIGGLAFGIGFVFAPVNTYLVGITSANFVVFLAGLFQFVALFTSSYCKEIWQLYLGQGILMGFGLALVSTPIPVIIPQWFEKYRSRALLLGASGTGLGGIMFNLAIQKIIEEWGVAWARRIQSFMVISVCTVCSLLIRTRNEKIKPEFKPLDTKILFSFPFIVMLLWLMFTMLAYVTTQYSMTNSTVALGYTARQGSITIVLFNVGAIIGRPSTGVISDKFGPVTTATFIYFFASLLCFAMWIPARNLPTMYVFGIVIGFIAGFVLGALPAVVPRIVGLRKLQVAYGMAYSVLGASGVVSPVIGLSLRKHKEAPGQYTWVAMFAGLCFFMSGFWALVLRAYIIAKDKLTGFKNPDLGEDVQTKVPMAMVIENLFTVRHKQKV
ncbi:hypothetical protein DASC09_006040 [Saccharomycopsis crataegensis]|uniref:Major facilitator superfamily (MFS) profile domain-containing protein n=1 Tax=Saccharomycopsis crataegensis TaxID=43959 RepID=A0AAV5QEX6_9ASCO|nr:hypothetical protein DASC09_006040 [Saccharomycopsis crataegensis]